jgi:fimbrial chaperone protein
MSVGGALRWILAAAAAFTSSWAAAASFGVSPIGLTIAPNESSGSVVVTNTGTDTVVIQARAFAWSQAGSDVRSETRDLILNPPIFKLAAGESQLVRIASRLPAPDEKESAFRLTFREVPALAAAPTSGLRIAVAMDVPLYIAPRKPAAPRMAWRFEETGGKPRLLAENSGNRHLRLSDVKVMDGGSEVASVPRLVVLANSSFAVDLQAAAKSAKSLRLIGRDDDNQPLDVEVPVPAGRP